MKETWRRMTRSQTSQNNVAGRVAEPAAQQSNTPNDDQQVGLHESRPPLRDSIEAPRQPRNGFFLVGAEAGGLDAPSAVREFLGPTKKRQAIEMGGDTGKSDVCVVGRSADKYDVSDKPEVDPPKPSASVPIPQNESPKTGERVEERLEAQIRHECLTAEAAMYWRLASSGLAVAPPEFLQENSRRRPRGTQENQAAIEDENADAPGSSRTDLPRLRPGVRTRSSDALFSGTQQTRFGGAHEVRRMSRKRSSQEMIFAMDGLDFGSSNSLASATKSPRGS